MPVEGVGASGSTAENTARVREEEQSERDKRAIEKERMDDVPANDRSSVSGASELDITA